MTSSAASGHGSNQGDDGNPWTDMVASPSQGASSSASPMPQRRIGVMDVVGDDISEGASDDYASGDTTY